MNEDIQSILIVHNRYQQRGGEDAVFEAESNLLERHGHRVERLEFDNSSISDSRSPLATINLAASTIWNRGSLGILNDAIERSKPDIIHFHNTLPLVSPAGYHAARGKPIGTVQTLHNYRLMCPNALFFRDGGPCEDCLGKMIAWPGIKHGCYRDSRAQTATVAAMVATHRLLGTWRNDVDRYIALTGFSRQKFVEGGLPADRIAVKPNFLDSVPPPASSGRDGFLFVGRLAESKGIDDMLAAWSDHQLPDTLRIAGGGPLEATVQAAAAQHEPIEALGMLKPAEVLQQMATAAALVYPSTWYENFPMTLVESFASGLPVIAARLGAMAEIIEDGRTGLLYDPGNTADLAAKVQWAAAHPEAMAGMGQQARAEYESRYSGDRNYHQLIGIYRQALDSRLSGTTVRS